MKLIQYIGRKSIKTDTIARTGLEWTPGQVHPVSDEAALKLLGYPSVWVEVQAEVKKDTVKVRPLKRAA